MKKITIIFIAFLIFIPISANATTVGLWCFDEGAGTTAYDSSGYGNDGTLVNNLTWSTDTPFTYSGNNSLSFDGSDDYVEVSDSSSLNPSIVTVEAWFKLDTLSTRPHIVGKGTASVGSYWLVAETSTKARFFYDLGGGWNYIESDTSLNSNTWYHIAGTYDSEYARIFLNGSLEKQAYNVGTLRDDTYPLIIGSGDGYGYTDGLIDEVRISNTALSVDELGYHQSCVPEPATMILLGSLATGLFGFAGLKRRFSGR